MSEIERVRGAVHDHLQSHGVYAQIRGIINAYAAEHEDFNPHNTNDVMSLLRERGLVQQIARGLNVEESAESKSSGMVSRAVTTSAPVSLKGKQQFLHCRLQGGRAFLDNVEPIVDDESRQLAMFVNIHFGKDRFRSAPQRSVCDPPFNDDFLMELASVPPPLENGTLLHIIVTQEDRHRYRTKVVGENFIDWRRALRTGTVNLSIELSGGNPGVPAGVLDICLELVPSPARASDEDISWHVERDKATNTAADREFLLYARRWWQEYQRLSSEHSDRCVKVLAQTTSGRMLPVTKFVTPMRPDRVLDGPEDAARFVSLFAVDLAEDKQRDLMEGAGTRTSDQWQLPYHFLVQRRGDGPNHATLLCSLFLGFGLDAYCAMGHDGNNKPCIFVLIRRRIAEHKFEVTFWEPTTGQQYQQQAEHPYKTVDCVFNDVTLYANIAPRTNAASADFDLDEENNWKPLNPIKLRVVPKPQSPSLLWIPLDPRAIELDLEARLRATIQLRRESNCRVTRWDEELGATFAQALVKYEAQRRGSVVDLSLFHACIKGHMGDGYTFKGFPINVAHVNDKKIVSSLEANATGARILDTERDGATFAIRTKVFVFPEAILSVWILLGTRYRSLPE